MAVPTLTKEEQAILKFENNDKHGKLLYVGILTEEWERRQYRIWFRRVQKRVCLASKFSFELVKGEPITEDPDWIISRFFKPSIRQARAIFHDHN